MTYSDVPLANQRILTTQPLIRQNFQFIETDVRVDHVFNANVPAQAEGTHRQVSLKGIVQPAVAPTGIQGIAYLGTDSNFKLWKAGAAQSLNMSVYAISAAINFNGQTLAINSSFNVASVVAGGSNTYTITFTTPLLTNDYLVMVTGMKSSSGVASGGVAGNATYGNSYDTSFVRIQMDTSNALAINVIVFGGQ